MTILGRSRECVCVGSEGGLLRAMNCTGVFCVTAGLQTLSVLPSSPPGRVQTHDAAQLNSTWRKYTASISSRETVWLDACGLKARTDLERKASICFSAQQREVWGPGWVRGIFFCHLKQGMLFAPRDWTAHTKHNTHKKRLTKIPMISSGFLSSTGIPLTSFSSSPTWISPTTQKHTVYVSTIILIFHYFNVLI